ncbi:hypothetical protein QZH56_15815 [Streptomyces olivoreticuli]|uniref:hypothetical protein n=1 Tax=Streptomyces olivoreticuli TaxID=68246 RepID=UPI00265AC2BD|nr:hypothetical protein [Streptomyces olivoreticuli]WKK21918.1 hypothetical protein QZH56_24250 [Streptomyces olivoreticuli]WKK26926.1 hypothetical protein QZH56_15815 [Streptomyces olivoreticuli]
MASMTVNAVETARQVRRARLAGIIGLTPLPVMIVVCALGHFPYPNDNLNGRKFLDYGLPHRTFEIQGLLWIVVAVATLGFILLLAAIHASRSGGMNATGLVMAGCADAYASATLGALGMYLAIALLARGYPGFTGDRVELLIVTWAWDTSQAIFLIATVFLVPAFVMIFTARSLDTVLTRNLRRAAIVVAVPNMACFVSTFIDYGPLSPASVWSYMPAGVVTYGWMAAASFALLRTKSAPDILATPVAELDTEQPASGQDL